MKTTVVWQVEDSTARGSSNWRAPVCALLCASSRRSLKLNRRIWAENRGYSRRWRQYCGRWRTATAEMLSTWQLPLKMVFSYSEYIVVCLLCMQDLTVSTVSHNEPPPLMSDLCTLPPSLYVVEIKKNICKSNFTTMPTYCRYVRFGNVGSFSAKYNHNNKASKQLSNWKKKSI
jgi:hypothetical protein